MKLVFALYKYFPFGGLQRDMLAIARECAGRGHQVQIFCQGWSGEYPSEDNIQVNILPDQKRWWKSSANHHKNSRFGKELKKTLSCIKPDVLVGFNRISGVDIYYAADSCFKAKLYGERPWIYRYLPRYRHFVAEEVALFSSQATTHILAIARNTLEEYRQLYQTPQERFTLLPPGISRDRVNISGEKLNLLRNELGLGAKSKIVLMVGSGFRTKGLDRAIHALVALPENIRGETHLVIAGEDNRESFVQQAQHVGIEKQLHFLGGRKDIPELLKSADLLIHPAYREAGGIVLLEAAVAGLPVLTTANCGHSHYIADHQLGLVLDSPFKQEALNAALEQMLTDAFQQQAWQENARRFASAADIYDMPKRAADSIEQHARQKKGIAL